MKNNIFVVFFSIFLVFIMSFNFGAICVNGQPSDYDNFPGDPTNNAPSQPFSPQPENEAINVELNTFISVVVYDKDDDSLAVLFYNALDDSLIDAVSGTSGERASVLWTDLSADSIYSWYAVVTDFVNKEVRSNTFKFTTKSINNTLNNPPYKPRYPTPEDNEIDVDLNATLSISVADPDGDDLTVDFFVGGTQFLSSIGSTTVSSDSIASVVWENLDYETEYSWYAVASDSEYENTSDVFTFTTKAKEQTDNNPPSLPNSPQPPLFAKNINLNPTLSVYVTDPDEDDLIVTFYNDADDSLIGSKTVSSNSRASTTWSNLDYETSYSWYVEVSDSEYIITSETYSFTTKNETMVQNNPPYKPESPTPSNGATNVDINATLKVYVFDPDDDYLTVNFYDSNDNLIGSDTTNSGNIASASWNNLDYNTSYSWYVLVSDSELTNQSDIFTFTTKSETIEYDTYGWIIGTVKVEYNDETVPANKAEICVYKEDTIEIISCIKSDENGIFLFSQIEPGTYKIKATKEKQSSDEKTISVYNNQFTNIDITIEVDQNRYNIEKEIKEGNIGGEILVEETEPDVYEHEIIQYHEISIDINQISKGLISVLLDGDETLLGKTIVITVDEDIFDKEFAVEYDGKTIDMADDVDDIFNPNDDGACSEYLMVKGSEGNQILVSIPHFSQHEIKIYSIAESLEKLYDSNTILFYILFCAILSIIIYGVVYISDRYRL